MNQILFGDCRDIMSDWNLLGVKVQMCVTSPPYFGLRDYGVAGQLGLESTPNEYVKNLAETFRLVRDLLADDGTLWLNLGDSYAGSWGNQGRKKTRGSQRSINGEMMQPVLDGRYPSKKSNTGKIPEGSGLKPKDLMGIPWAVAFALRADGWYLRQDIIWHKPNPMPESITDRCTKAHEYIFLLSKSPKYYFDWKAMQEPAITYDPRWKDKQRTKANIDGNMSERGITRTTEGLNLKPAWEKTKETRNRRSVWTVTTKPYKGAHFATFPTDLIEPCVLAGSRPGDIVLDPFMGSGTTAQVALKHGRGYLGCELNPEYEKLQLERIAKVSK